MRIGSIGIEACILNLIYRVDSIGIERFFDFIQLVANYEGFQLDTELIGKYAALGSRLTSATLPSSYSQYTIKLLLSVMIVLIL